MHCKVVKDKVLQDFIIDEWIAAALVFDNIYVTNKLKQQNPFTDEFFFLDVVGAGYWIPKKSKFTGWPGDGSVCFAPSGNGVLFIQFNDIDNPELIEIADSIGGKVVSHVIGG